MRHVGKKLLAFGMAVSILISAGARAEEPPLSSEVKAEEPSAVFEGVPCSARLPKVQAKLSISKSGRVKVSGTVRKKSSIRRISGTVSLEKYASARKKWRQIKKWNVAKDCSGLSFSYRYKLPKKGKRNKKKGKYRVRIKLLVYEGEGERGMPANGFSKTRKY